MKLNLYWRGRDVIDIELHLWRLRKTTTVVKDDGPSLRAGASLQSAAFAKPTTPQTTIGFTST
ncbi:MAG: hypothetical protein JWR85_4061 [Marmoricola sp.]|nr:hypothetical protein [Marmoricola sp.]